MSFKDNKRKFMPTMPPRTTTKGTKKQKTDKTNTENQTNVQHQDVAALRQHYYEVEPVDYDTPNVFVPFDWVCMLHYICRFCPYY